MSRVVMNFAVILIISFQVTSVFLTRFDGVDVNLVEDKTFIKLKNLVRAVVPRIKKLSSSESCSIKCDSSQFHSISNTVKTQTEPCVGRVMNCDPLKSTLCSNTLMLHKVKTSLNTDKKLVAINDNTTIYGELLSNVSVYKYIGPKENCEGDNRTSYDKCHFCMCDCIDDYEQLENVRSFSLRDETSDILKNMVMTGLKFVRNGGMIHIQIAQNELAPNYTIVNKNNQRSWNPINKIENISTQLIRFGSNRRKVNLDDITLPKNYVLTGVRFKNCNDSEKEALGIEIQGTKVDWEAGKLKVNTSMWFNSTYMVKNNLKSYGPDKERKEICLKDVEDSLGASENYEISETNRFIEFTTTSRMRTLGNSTIPYFFVTNVTADKPLVGAGLTYKKARGYGGFIALKVISSDFSTGSASGLSICMIMSVIVFPLGAIYF